MRVTQSLQSQLSDYSISEIRFDLKSRDDIPQILRGLQYIYVNIELRNAVFKLLDKHIQPEADSKNGRPGMDLWKIFVAGVLRLDLNWDYDRLHEQVNNHKTIRQIDQTTRRVVEGKAIPHGEKVFSLFEPHTEWIVKGKAGVPMELGMRVCIMEDQLLLHHQVMEKQTDDQVAISMVSETIARFPSLATCSFDKGYHSPKNQKALAEMLDVVALPCKGKQFKKIQEIESSQAFLQAKQKHSAVESAINGLGAHGLDRCPDHGLDAFKRYVALSIVGRNLQRVGVILIEQERKHLEKMQKKKLKKAA